MTASPAQPALLCPILFVDGCRVYKDPSVAALLEPQQLYGAQLPPANRGRMGVCRTANGYDINGFGQLKDGRGNICPTTIIMPTLAMEADRDVEKFMKLLDKKIHEAKDTLIERFDWICSQDPKTAPFMWDNNTMAGYIPEEGIRSAMKHGTLAIGQLGLAETLQLLIGTDQTTPRGMALAKRIESLFQKRCKEFKEKYKLNFGVYYTPAENLCYTAMQKFRAKYGKIKNVSDREYFTNSIHVPVWHEMTPFQKIDIESQLTGYSSAGCITYVELPSPSRHQKQSWPGREWLQKNKHRHSIPRQHIAYTRQPLRTACFSRFHAALPDKQM